MPGQDRARAGLGTTLSVANGTSPETFTAIAEVKDIDGPNLKLSTADSTHLADTWKGIKPILLEAGEVKLTVNWLVDDATQNLSSGVLAVMTTKTLRDFQIAWSNGLGGIAATWLFAGYVTNVAPKLSVTTLQSAVITISIDGIPAFV